MALQGRALHYVFKIGDRAATARFYRDILGMKLQDSAPGVIIETDGQPEFSKSAISIQALFSRQVLRHEEFSDGCEAQCNGPYANRWSKTMVGYGCEDTHFVVELTYNYGIKSYDRGNDFLGITIQSSDALKNARENGIPVEKRGDEYVITAPGGYPFFLIDKPQPSHCDPVKKVTLASSQLLQTVDFWSGLLGLKKCEENENWVEFSFGEKQASLRFETIATPLDRKKAYGRVAFSIPTEQLKGLEKKMRDAGQKILTPLISLDTPGKATVSVVILADPDSHEICFVGEEGFRDLSQMDPSADPELNKYLKSDKS